MPDVTVTHASDNPSPQREEEKRQAARDKIADKAQAKGANAAPKAKRKSAAPKARKKK